MVATRSAKAEGRKAWSKRLAREDPKHKGSAAKLPHGDSIVFLRHRANDPDFQVNVRRVGAFA